MSLESISISVEPSDLERLQQGQPPKAPDLLAAMTVGQDIWLDRFTQECLQNFVGEGGSKVKLLLGEAGMGKTHLLRCAVVAAQHLGFATVELSVRDVKIHKLVELYQEITRALDLQAVVQGLCRQIGSDVGEGDYDGKGVLLPRMYKNMNEAEAKQIVYQKIRDRVNCLDVLPCFKTWVASVVRYRTIEGDERRLSTALQWLAGERLPRAQAKDLGLFAGLKATNARAWLNSFLKLLVASGKRGLLIALDNLEALTEKDPETKRYRYTLAAGQDVYEVIRQILDDMELVPNLGLLLAGHSILLHDEKRGLQSYDALWLRLQSGILPDPRFNPFADTVEVDKHFAAVNQKLSGRFAEEVSLRLQKILEKVCEQTDYKGLPADIQAQSKLRAAVMTVALGGAQ